ncbi:MAG TPA: hypothetical protein VHH36_00385 [Candidatus Thermoplasmatota archaeon]|nr:hypothetical protein [Candidatus Thermoplasmatota archaeon]
MAPTAAATGHLVNVNVLVTLQFGVNVFGGSGDTVDVSAFNQQCNDSDDVVDVSLLNSEGQQFGCANPNGCNADQGSDATGLTPLIAALLGNNPFAPGSTDCTDDGDTVDVGLLNSEGSFGSGCVAPDGTFSQCGDQEDAVDVGVINNEIYDDDDANDVGVLNCEFMDYDDGNDVGLLNHEEGDASDTFDASLVNNEGGDTPDRNGLNVLTGRNPIGCIQVVIDPCQFISPCPPDPCSNIRLCDPCQFINPCPPDPCVFIQPCPPCVPLKSCIPDLCTLIQPCPPDPCTFIQPCPPDPCARLRICQIDPCTLIQPCAVDLCAISPKLCAVTPHLP